MVGVDCRPPARIHAPAVLTSRRPGGPGLPDPPGVRHASVDGHRQRSSERTAPTARARALGVARRPGAAGRTRARPDRPPPPSNRRGVARIRKREHRVRRLGQAPVDARGEPHREPSSRSRLRRRTRGRRRRRTVPGRRCPVKATSHQRSAGNSPVRKPATALGHPGLRGLDRRRGHRQAHLAEVRQELGVDDPATGRPLSRDCDRTLDLEGSRRPESNRGPPHYDSPICTRFRLIFGRLSSLGCSEIATHLRSRGHGPGHGRGSAKHGGCGLSAPKDLDDLRHRVECVTGKLATARADGVNPP